MNKLAFNEYVEDNRTTKFADVLLPVPIPQNFTYRVPHNLESEVGIGCRVIVQFGRKRIITGILVAIHENPPQNYEAKYLLEILDATDEPTVVNLQLKFFSWISSYYMSAPGEVLHVGIPSGLKLSSESKIQLHPNFVKKDYPFPFDKHEKSILEVLEGSQNLSYSQISDITGLKNVYAVIKSLVKKESIILYEEVKEKYNPKKESRIRLSKKYSTEKATLESLFEELEKSSKQTEVLLSFLRSVPVYQDPKANAEGVSKKQLTDEGVSPSSIRTLIRNGVFEEFEIIKSRFAQITATEERKKLAPFQQTAFQEILGHFENDQPVLLHGITGSGKTEIYIDLIENVLENGYQVLYLLPEIALTTQMVERLKKVFGSRMGVYHSKFSDNERVEVYQGVRTGHFDFIVGVRSSIFLPFTNLGLIIIDEEHESSYKQNEPAPRYHARDAALYLAKIHQSRVLLGSATPSIESYFQTTEKSYGLVTLSQRYGKSLLPTIRFANVQRERKKKTMQGEFSGVLMECIQEALSSNHQVIIFQNRRGYAPYIHCDTCGWIPKCQNCSVSLTYHLYKNELRCHYCGYREKVPAVCPTCLSDNLSTKSFGTEKLEEDLKLMLPDHQVGRMDLDTTRSKFGYKTILENFEKGSIDILVGTQMVSKGLDFENVSLVGIVDADRMINFPDFRATERTFQLITQVSGRAGRREKQGEVLIQTYNPEQEILKHIEAYDYESFYKDEVAERQLYHYPPFYRLIGITLKHSDGYTCGKAAGKLHKMLAQEFGLQRTLGPQEGLIAKIRNMYIWEVLIKFERSKVNLSKVKAIIKEKSALLKSEKEFRQLRIIFDVDPY